jgi:hypothetical protein
MLEPGGPKASGDSTPAESEGESFEEMLGLMAGAGIVDETAEEGETLQRSFLPDDAPDDEPSDSSEDTE